MLTLLPTKLSWSSLVNSLCICLFLCTNLFAWGLYCSLWHMLHFTTILFVLLAITWSSLSANGFESNLLVILAMDTSYFTTLPFTKVGMCQLCTKLVSLLLLSSSLSCAFFCISGRVRRKINVFYVHSVTHVKHSPCLCGLMSPHLLFYLPHLSHPFAHFILSPCHLSMTKNNCLSYFWEIIKKSNNRLNPTAAFSRICTNLH